MQQLDLDGIFLPATTPFDPVTGDVDVIALRANLRAWLAAAPVAGVVLFGSTGEGVLIDDDERPRLLSAARELMPAEQALLAGVGAESTRATIRRARAAADAGADAVLVQPPAFYRPQMTPDALRDHFAAVADASPVPVLLYQVPPQYGTVELVAGLVGELAKHPNVLGIKDSSGDLRALGALVEACGKGCAVLAGSGAMLYGALETGAVGGILAVALLAPAACTIIHAAFRAGRFAEAGRMQEAVAPLHRAVAGGLGVPGIKCALDLLEMHGGAPRPPLKPLRSGDVARVRAALAALPGSAGAATLTTIR